MKKIVRPILKSCHSGELKQFNKECRQYYKQVRKENEKRLRVQRDNHLKECKRLLKQLGKKELYFRKAIKKIREDIIPYVKRMKWMPLSYQGMMIGWEVEYNEMRGAL